MTHEYEFKTISLGKEAVGKTSLIRRFAVGQFSETYIPTLGVDFFVKNVRIDKINVKLLLYDTAGQESFGPLRPLYYRKANGAFIVFDITQRSSFEKLDYWYNEVYINCGAIPYIIVGNKLDLEADRSVSIGEATTYAASNGLKYIETSAKTGENVSELFEILTEIMLKSQPRL
ncbi:MAG: Rab family GTPase [Candidatus Heimdallarchaeota archaeon]